MAKTLWTATGNSERILPYARLEDVYAQLEDFDAQRIRDAFQEMQKRQQRQREGMLLVHDVFLY